MMDSTTVQQNRLYEDLADLIPSPGGGPAVIARESGWGDDLRRRTVRATSGVAGIVGRLERTFVAPWFTPRSIWRRMTRPGKSPTRR